MNQTFLESGFPGASPPVIPILRGGGWALIAMPTRDGLGQVAVDRVAFLFTRHNRMLELSLEETFGSDGWDRYLDGFVQLAGIEAEREMEPDGMSMMA
jgi:hypothetical protein